MKKVLVASLVVVSLLLLTSGAMAAYGDGKEVVCPPEPCPPKEICPTINVCFPEMPVFDMDVCFPEAPCAKVVIEDFPEIRCDNIDFEFPEICCQVKEPCPEPEPEPCPPVDDECNDDNGKDDRHHRR